MILAHLSRAKDTRVHTSHPYFPIEKERSNNEVSVTRSFGRDGGAYLSFSGGDIGVPYFNTVPVYF